jgi:uncharacterized small protein (DUF1192 family)
VYDLDTKRKVYQVSSHQHYKQIKPTETDKMGVEEIEAKIEAIQSQIERYEARGDDVEPLNIELQRAERRLAKEEAKLPVHPA